MCLSTVAFSAMHGLVRYVSADMHPFQIAFFRNLFGLVFLLPLLIRSKFVIFKSQRIGLHVLRGVINIIAILMFYTALSLSPLAKVTALNFTAPIFMAVLSFVFLAERFRLHRWMAIIAAWMGIFLGLFSIDPALWVWQTPTITDIGWLVLIGLFGSMAHVTLAQSLKETDPTAIMPFDFLKRIWTALIGICVFAEIPDIFTWLGAAVIFSSGLYIAHRERRAVRTAATASSLPRGGDK